MPKCEQERLPGSIKNTVGNATESLLLPVVRWTTATLDEHELRRLREITTRIAKAEPALAATHVFGAHTRSGMSANLWLVIGDAREIALMKVGNEVTNEYRLSLLARPGDVAVFGGEPHYGFEHYRSQQIGLGPIVSINVRRFPSSPLLPLAERCRLDDAAFSLIVERTKLAGGLTIVPHIGMGSAWRLGAAVAEATGFDVCVASSPPRLTRRVNDKLWFAHLAAEILGETALPPTYAAHGPEFEQILEGEEGSFVGSVPAELPERWQRRLADDAMRLASALQFLGYFGRCSLDTLLVGQTFDSAILHWIECNGRWGGVSIPMTIVNRLTSGRAKAKFVVVQRTGDSRPPQSFADALQALNEILFRPGSHEKGIVLLSPVEIEAGRGVQMLACAETVAAARELSDRALEILSGVNARSDVAADPGSASQSASHL